MLERSSSGAAQVSGWPPFPVAWQNPPRGGGSLLSVVVERHSVSGEELRVLLSRIASGEAAALATFFDRTSRLVHGLALRILGAGNGDADEVTLDVYTQVWRQASRFDPARGEPLSWLLTLARSRAIDRLRSAAGARRREQGLGEDASPLVDLGPDPETSSALDERARCVRRAMSSLSPEQRQAIELAFFEGLTHVEIAQRLSQPLGTAKSRIRLAMARLRDELAAHAPERRA